MAVPNLSIDLVVIFILALVISIALIFYDQMPLFKELGIHTPFQYQKMIFEQYFEAKERLTKKKLEDKQAQANAPSQNASK